MFRSIAFKWIATLVLTSVVAVPMIGIFAFRATITEYDRLRMEQAQTAFISDVTGYYQDNGSWEGVETWLRDKEISPQNRVSLRLNFTRWRTWMVTSWQVSALSTLMNHDSRSTSTWYTNPG